eukprot:10369865-Heterocapsa_arctica.AAC.1
MSDEHTIWATASLPQAPESSAYVKKPWRDYTLAMTADHNASSSGTSSEPLAPESFDYYKKWWP